MIQLSELPRFRGDGQEDAEEWLQNFLLATANFNDAGAIRLLSLYIPHGSPAREWLNSLEADAKSSWANFEPHFHNKWIRPLPIRLDVAWTTFNTHELADEDIFDGWILNGGGEVSVAQRSITAWAEDHIQLGMAIDKDDTSLLQASINLIPPFLRAHILVSVTPQPKTIHDLCSALKNLPSAVLELELVRRDGSQDKWKAMIEQRLNMVIGISERMEKTLGEVSNRVNTLVQTGGHTMNPPHQPSCPQEEPETHDGLPSENIHWEPCSPITVATSLSSGTSSEVATPVAINQALPDVVQSNRDSPLGGTSTEHSTTKVDDSLCIPIKWRKTSTTLIHHERVGISHRSTAFANFLSILGQVSGDWAWDGAGFTPHQCEHYVTTLAVQDRLTKGITNKDAALKIFLSRRCNSSGSVLDDCDPKTFMLYHSFRGIALIHGYRAYENPALLTRAISRWTKLNEYVHATHNENTARFRRCFLGANRLAGGVLISKDASEISSAETVSYMTLSAYLAECTGEDRFKEASIKSANFVESFVLDGTTMLIKACTFDKNTLEEAIGGSLSCHITAIAIEGLAVLASITRDKSWMTLMIQIARAAMHTPFWHSAEGILTVGSDGDPSKIDDAKALKGTLMRGLLEAYERNPDNIPFRNLVRGYVNVQYNALLNHARYGNAYGVDWRGPYKGPYAHGQMAALDALVVAIGVNDS